MGAVNTAVSKQIFKKKMTVKMGVRDLFRTANFGGHSRYADVDLDIFNNRRLDNRQFNVSIVYKFGKTGIAPERNRRGGASEEQGRVKSGN